MIAELSFVLLSIGQSLSCGPLFNTHFPGYAWSTDTFERPIFVPVESTTATTTTTTTATTTTTTTTTTTPCRCPPPAMSTMTSASPIRGSTTALPIDARHGFDNYPRIVRIDSRWKAIVTERSLSRRRRRRQTQCPLDSGMPCAVDVDCVSTTGRCEATCRTPDGQAVVACDTADNSTCALGFTCLPGICEGEGRRVPRLASRDVFTAIACLRDGDCTTGVCVTDTFPLCVQDDNPFQLGRTTCFSETFGRSASSLPMCLTSSGEVTECGRRPSECGVDEMCGACQC